MQVERIQNEIKRLDKQISELGKKKSELEYCVNLNINKNKALLNNQ